MHTAIDTPLRRFALGAVMLSNIDPRRKTAAEQDTASGCQRAGIGTGLSTRKRGTGARSPSPFAGAELVGLERVREPRVNAATLEVVGGRVRGGEEAVVDDGGVLVEGVVDPCRDRRLAGRAGQAVADVGVPGVVRGDLVLVRRILVAETAAGEVAARVTAP